MIYNDRVAFVNKIDMLLHFHSIQRGIPPNAAPMPNPSSHKEYKKIAIIHIEERDKGQNKYTLIA